MVGEVFSGLSAIKAAFDIAKGLKDIDDATRRNAAVIELQEKILAAHSMQAASFERIRELEAQVASFEKWEADKDRYELKKFGHGVARFLKQEAQGAELSHPICANCFEKRKIKFLQEVPTNIVRQNLGKGEEWRCPECSTNI